jgi:hypothetical protein
MAESLSMQGIEVEFIAVQQPADMFPLQTKGYANNDIQYVYIYIFITFIYN